MEVYKSIELHPSYYISNYGNIKNIYDVLRVPRKDKSGFLQCYIHTVVSHSSEKCYHIHKLVAEHFLVCPNPNFIVSHKDGDRTNNHVDNLFWKPRGKIVEEKIPLALGTVSKSNKAYMCNYPIKNGTNRKGIRKQFKNEFDAVEYLWMLRLIHHTTF